MALNTLASANQTWGFCPERSGPFSPGLSSPLQLSLLKHVTLSHWKPASPSHFLFTRSFSFEYFFSSFLLPACHSTNIEVILYIWVSSFDGETFPPRQFVAHSCRPCPRALGPSSQQPPGFQSPSTRGRSGMFAWARIWQGMAWKCQNYCAGVKGGEGC